MPNSLLPWSIVPSLYHKVNTSPPLGRSEKRKGVDPVVSPVTPSLPIIHLFFLLHPCECLSAISLSKTCSLVYFIAFQKRGGKGDHIASLWDHSGSSQSRHSLPGRSFSPQHLALQSLQPYPALLPGCHFCSECSFPQCPPVTVLLIFQNPVPIPNLFYFLCL